MNNKLICPFCNETELEKGIELRDGCFIMGCPKCKKFAHEVFWQELIRTRKALGIAQDWLEQVATPAKCDDDLCREFTKRKLVEIKTALEQKE